MRGLAMFSIGELVVHPMHGAGVIDDIVQERLDGKTKEYYVFKMPVGGLILKIPVANSEAIGIRGIISPIEAEALFDAIPELSIDANTNWNKRYQENMLRLKSGDLYEVARVIKALMHRDHCRGLCTGERKMLHNARQIMLSEIVLAQECEYHEVELRLDKAMMQIPVV
jgi:CarD family transcriptional regulator